MAANATQPGAPRATRGPPRVATKLEKEADLVMGTNNSSIVSKRSVELRYSPRYEYFRPFVLKPQRRAPLINRGYWLRMHAIAETVRRFLQQPDDRPKYVLNLGCGYDPLAFEFLDREKSICQNATFVDIDYEKLMGIKSTIIQQTDSLQQVLGKINTYPETDAVRLRAPQYVAIGCDLKNLHKLESALGEVLGAASALVLCIAEVSLTYMDIDSADALLTWIPKLGKDTEFCLLEQFFPDGPDHPFAYTMMNHFHKLRAPLYSIHKYPSLHLQEERFVSKGWLSASARSLWDVWSDNSFLSASQRRDLDKVEPFDEWEEFALFASHYFLLKATTFEKTCSQTADTSRCARLPKAQLALLRFKPQSQKHRRFSAAVPDSEASFGVHGGLGDQTRMASTDVYVAGRKITKPVHTLPPDGLPARMCHTITELHNGNCLLVGGRASPAVGLNDCWMRQNGIWKPVHSLSSSRFRHCAVCVQVENRPEQVLVYGGKNHEGIITQDEWLLWDAQSGWQKPEIHCQSDIPSRFGASMVKTTPSTGILFGGMSQDGVILSDVWRWSVTVREGENIVIELIDQTDQLRKVSTAFDYIGRFGATATMVSDTIVIIGGVGVHGVLPHELEILCLDVTDLAKEEITSLTVHSMYTQTKTAGTRPLLVGHVSCNAGSSSTGVIISGGAVCFSFGTFWNTDIWTLHDMRWVEDIDRWDLLDDSKETKRPKSGPTANGTPRATVTAGEAAAIPRQTVETQSEFEEIMARAQPVVIAGADLGRCTSTWSKDYLIETLGADRQIIVHEAHTGHMNFQKKNFTYNTKSLKAFLDEIYQGSRQYLRSISVQQPTKTAASLAADFPEIQADFQLPPSLNFVQEHAHSSPLRISGPVTMWLHYDVMANVYCQIKGQKKMILYPPSDVQYLKLPPGASSSTLDIFQDDASDGGDKVLSIPNTSPHEAVLNPGDILFIPPLWLHAASPTEGVSIAVNVFFRNLSSGYAVGRDVYANRDLQAYEKGRAEVMKICRSFDNVPSDMANFYLLRLADELREKAER